MSEKTVSQGPGPQGEFEHEDLSARAIFSFLLGLAVVCVVVYFILLGVYDLLDAYQRKHQPQPNPLVTTVETDTRTARPETRMKFPEPRLEVNERGELKDFRLDEETQLNTYGWVDQKAGVARIPIDRAMQLIVQRGLPVRPQGAIPPVATERTKAGVKPQGRPGTSPTK